MPPLDVPAPKAAEKLNGVPKTVNVYCSGFMALTYGLSAVARLQREQMMEHVSQSLFRLVDTLKGKGERVRCTRQRSADLFQLLCCRCGR